MKIGNRFKQRNDFDAYRTALVFSDADSCPSYKKVNRYQIIRPASHAPDKRADGLWILTPSLPTTLKRSSSSLLSDCKAGKSRSTVGRSRNSCRRRSDQPRVPGTQEISRAILRMSCRTRLTTIEFWRRSAGCGAPKSSASTSPGNKMGIRPAGSRFWTRAFW